ncbi:hypothetical protein GCM10020254_30790 [Streptomyces goshikiensis]
MPAAWWELLAEGVGVALVTRLSEGADRAVSEVVRATDVPGTDSERRAGELLATRRPGRDALYGGSGLVLVEAYPSAPYVVIGGGRRARGAHRPSGRAAGLGGGDRDGAGGGGEGAGGAA